MRRVSVRLCGGVEGVRSTRAHTRSAVAQSPHTQPPAPPSPHQTWAALRPPAPRPLARTLSAAAGLVADVASDVIALSLAALCATALMVAAALAAQRAPAPRLH